MMILTMLLMLHLIAQVVPEVHEVIKNAVLEHDASQKSYQGDSLDASHDVIYGSVYE